MSPDSLHQTDPKHLAALLAPMDVSHIWSDADMAGMLRHQLDSALPIAAADDQGIESPATIADLLVMARPPLALLERVKELAKSARRDRQSGVPPQISAALYYCAIFVAMMRTGVRLTRLDSPSLSRGARFLVAQPWLDPRVRSILEAGIRHLHEQHD